MRIPGRTTLVACTLALAVGFLSACTPSHPVTHATKTPSPTPSPVFTSDAEALAAATATYERFLRASDEVGHDGGANPERVADYADKDVVEAEKAQAQKLIDAHARSYGFTRVSASSLQSMSQRDAEVRIAMYACEDLREVDVRDESGKSLISSTRADFVAYVVQLSGNSPDHLIVTSNKFWSGGSVCKS